MQRVAHPAPHCARARYLGGRIGANFSYAVEYAHRKKAVAAAGYSSGAFWCLKHAPRRAKRALLMCCVQNTALHS
eukprot:4932051-Pyramimonas_sp.AAC.1